MFSNMEEYCLRLFLALTSLTCLVSSLPSSPRTNTHFSSRSFGSPSEDLSHMGGVRRPSYTGGVNNPDLGANNYHGSAVGNNPSDGRYNDMNNHYGNERGFPNNNGGLREDEWGNNYRGNNNNENTDRGSNPNFNRRLETNQDSPSFNRPAYNTNGREDKSRPMGGSMPGITPHRASFPNSHVRPLTPLSYHPISPHLDTNEPSTIEAAFEGCQKHPQAGQHVNGRFQTEVRPLEHQSHIAVYPLTDHNPELMVKIMMPSRQYQVTVQGTNVKLEKCDTRGSQCTIEDEKATKTKAIISPQKWNYIYSQLESNSITVGIGAETEVMSMPNIPATDLSQAEWLVQSGDGSVRGADGQPGSVGGGGSFVVEYPCAEYVATHFSPTPAPHPRPGYPTHRSTPAPTDPIDVTDAYPETSPTYIPNFTGAVAGYTTETPMTDGGDPSAALIVGVIGALLLLGLVVAIVVSVVKKRRSMAVTEATPLSEQKRGEAAEQQYEQKVDEPTQEK